MLGGLALKRLWQHKRKAEGKSTEKPNLIMSAAVQVVWEKFCNYWDIEPRYVPVTPEHMVLDGYELEKYVDENTIGVVAILGQTFTGAYEPVEAIAAELDEIQAEHRPRHQDPRRRRLRCDGRPVLPARPGVGLPDRSRELDQHLRPQVRAGVPGCGLGRLAEHRRSCPRA